MSNQDSTKMRGVTLTLLIMIVLCIVGGFLSLSLQDVHSSVHEVGSSGSACNVNESVSCDAVAQSAYSTVLGVSVSVWALIGYAFMAFLVGLTAAVGMKSKEGASTLPRFGYGLLVIFSGVYLTVSLSLIYVMWQLIGKWCLYCLALDGINAALFICALVLPRLTGRGIGGALVDDLSAFNKRPGLMATVAAIGLVSLGVGFLFQEEEKKLSLDGLEYGATEVGHHWIGAKDAPVIVEEYSDYECPHCKLRHTKLRELMKSKPGRVKIIHRHFPLDKTCNSLISRDFHQFACDLSRTTVCAGRQEMFWQANDLIFNEIDDIKSGAVTIEGLAEELELDMGAFQACMKDETSLEEVKADVAVALRLGIRGTPTFLVNGVMKGDPFAPEIWDGDAPTLAAEGITSVGREGLKTGVDAKGRPWIGAENAPVVIDGFLDYQCASCKETELKARRALVANPGKVKYVRRFMPMGGECNALLEKKEGSEDRSCELTRLAACSVEQGKFWETNDYLLDHLVGILTNRVAIHDIAKEVSLDTAKLDACMKPEAIDPTFAADIKMGSMLSFFEGSGFLVNGELSEGFPAEESWKGAHRPLKSGSREGLETGKTETGTPWIGAKDAEIVIDVFFDYTGETIRGQLRDVRALMKAAPSKAKLVMHQFPMSKRCNPAFPGEGDIRSCVFAFVAMCANKHGDFWAVNDYILDNLTEVLVDDLSDEAWAKRIGVDVPTLQGCFKDEELQKTLFTGIKAALEHKFQSVPLFLVNGEVKTEGVSEKLFK